MSRAVWVVTMRVATLPWAMWCWWTHPITDDEDTWGLL